MIVSSDQQARPLQGSGVTIAIVDSGLMSLAKSSDWDSYDAATGTLIAEGLGRCMIYRDFLTRSTANGNSGADARNSTDQHGHGTHVASTIADNRAVQLQPTMKATLSASRHKRDLLVARALDKTGAGTYGDVIRAIGVDCRKQGHLQCSCPEPLALRAGHWPLLG